MRSMLTMAACFAILAGEAHPAPPPEVKLFPSGAQRGQTASLIATGKFKSWPVNVAIDGVGLQLNPDNDSGKFHLEVAADAVPGIRWVRLYNPEGTTAPIPLVVGTLKEISESEPNDLPAQVRKQLLEHHAVTINGQLQQDTDVDIYAIPLQKGQTLIADLDAYRPLGASMDGILQLLSPEGFVLLQNNDEEGFDPRIVYTAQNDGTVLVRLFAFPTEPNADIKLSSSSDYLYRLTLTTGPFLDHCFPLALEQGKETVLQLMGWNLNDMLSSKSVTIPMGQNGQLVFDSTQAGNWLLSGETITTLLEREPNDIDHPQLLSFPCVLSGRICEPHDDDAYSIELHKNQSVLVCVESNRLGFPLDPVLTISRTSDNKELFKQDDDEASRDIHGVFTAPEDGLYRLTINDLYKEGSLRHAYRLRITTEKDFQLSVAASEFTIPAGKNLEVPVQVTRQLDFNDEIDLVVEGLPKGTTYSSTRSKPDGESSKQVTVSIKAGEEPFSGNFFIKGRSATNSSVEHLAHVRPTKTNPFSGVPWLTITTTK